MRLDDKVAVITGAGSGMGAEGARMFAREGAKVVVADINDDGGLETVASVQAAGGEATYVHTDVTMEEDCRALAAAAVDRFGGIDIVWANAGIAHPFIPIEQISLDLYHKVMDVNVLGPWLTIREALPALRRADNAAVVITASLSGLKARADLSVYQSSKGAAVMLAQSLAMEFAPIGIRVNSVCPVAADTPMLPEFIPNLEDEARTAISSAIPLGRLATAADVANAALFLASQEAAMVTGLALRVDGGARA